MKDTLAKAAAAKETIPMDFQSETWNLQVNLFVLLKRKGRERPEAW